jgi:hypothetical protein
LVRHDPYDRAVFRWFGRLPRFLRSRSGVETSRLIVGSTGSGKSEGELVDLVRLADERGYAVVLLDGHGPLALSAAGHWAARGHTARMVYEPLEATDRVLCWHMLPRSAETDLSKRRIKDNEVSDEVAQCFMTQRGLETLNDRAWTKEWLEAAIALCLSQPQGEPLSSLPSAFQIGSLPYERLLEASDRPDVVSKFRDLEQIKRKNAVQYELFTGPARRLLEQVCSSEVVRLRSRPGPFDWLEALRSKQLLAFDGGGIRSREIKRTLFLLITVQVIHAVRRHFAATQRPLPVVLVLEEAGALGLVTPFVLLALKELRKAGLAVHIITQSTLDFGDTAVFESALGCCPWQAWYQALSPADQELGARALSNATFDPLAVHFTRIRSLHDHLERIGPTVQTRFRHVVEATYKTPQLHEQEYRTALATLRLGERLVRDRDGVVRERVRPVRPPWFRDVSDAATRAVIERLRRQPIYLPNSEPAPAAGQLSAVLPDAAARLRSRG